MYHCRLAAARKNRREFVGFLQQKRQLVFWNKFAIADELEPIQTFIRFFYRNAKLGCKFCS